LTPHNIVVCYGVIVDGLSKHPFNRHGSLAEVEIPESLSEDADKGDYLAVIGVHQTVSDAVYIFTYAQAERSTVNHNHIPEVVRELSIGILEGFGSCVVSYEFTINIAILDQLLNELDYFIKYIIL
jgi:hypothetical protein